MPEPSGSKSSLRRCSKLASCRASLPRVAFTPQWGVSVVCYGDDFTALGTGAGLSMYGACMAKAFDCDVRGRLGSGPGGLKEVKILNRILRVTPRGLSYEADPRHTELLARALGRESSGRQGTPGIKEYQEHAVADCIPQHEDAAKAAVQCAFVLLGEMT